MEVGREDVGHVRHEVDRVVPHDRHPGDVGDDLLQRTLGDRRQELFNLRFQSATGALENSARVRSAKREIARILTVRHERERAGNA